MAEGGSGIGHKDAPLPVSCDLSPELHPSTDYPVPLQLWGKLQDVLDYYKASTGLCEPSAILPHWPPVPKVTTYHLNMSDGVKLWTITIDPAPHSGTRKGAVICRSPYGPTTQHLADIFGFKNGAVIVLQDDRGTWRSAGEFDLWRGSAQDDIETFNWIIDQPWSNGEVSTVGISADGISSATVILKSPTMIKAQWFAWTTMEGHDFVYPDGAYRLDLTEGYLDTMNVIDGYASERVTAEVRDHEGWSQWWYNLTACRDVASPTLPTCHYQQVKWPILFTAGQWDIFMKSQLGVWAGLRMDSDPAVRDKHVLFIGPLGHCLWQWDHFPTLARGELSGVLQAIEVMSEFMSGRTDGPARSKVKRINIYVMGAFADTHVRRPGNYWTSLDDFPDSKPTSMYLAAGNQLSYTKPKATSGVQYAYDPEHPAPMIGGSNLPGVGKIPICGPADQTKRHDREDVILFTGSRLSEEVVVAGNIFVRLYVSSSAKDTDFFATVEDVTPALLSWRSTSYLVRYGITRLRWRESDEKQAPALEQDKVYEVVIDCGFIAYVFEKGHHIRVTVSSSATPYYNANFNSGDSEVRNKTVPPVVAQNTVHLGGAYASEVILPVSSLNTLPRNEHLDWTIPDDLLKSAQRSGTSAGMAADFEQSDKILV